jgi:hypothetical protein
MSARQAAEYLGFTPDRRGVRALYQATYRIPALRACLVALGGTRRGLRFDRVALDGYLEARQVDRVRLTDLHHGATRLVHEVSLTHLIA